MSKKPENILIVEDEIVTQRYLKDILAEQGMTTAIVIDNGEDTLKHLEKEHCDLILMDINIKGPLDGLRLAKRILEKQDICIIFITAYSDENTLDEAVELSPYGFIVKPFVPEDIKIAIQIGYKRFLVHQSEKKKHCAGESRSEDHVIVISKNLIYNSASKLLLEKGAPVDLSARQLHLIEILAQNINNVVSKEMIMSRIWGDMQANEISLRSLIYSIRRKLPSLPLVTYSKIGYLLKSEKHYY